MLSLPKVYKNDIDANITNIDTLLVINTTTPIYISTRKGMFESEMQYYEDRDLRVTGISESIDLKTKKFKIGKVKVNITNIEVDGIKFSDMVADVSLLGTSVVMYYKTQSARVIDDCLRIADGKIIRYSHTHDTVKLEIEDRTMDKIHKDIPLSDYVFYSELDVLEHHIGKPVPILYGELEKAPSIIYTNATTSEDVYQDNNLMVLYDNSPLATHTVRGVKRIDYNETKDDVETGILYIEDGDKYLEIPQLPYENVLHDIQGRGSTHGAHEGFGNHNHGHDYPQYQLQGESGQGYTNGSYLQLTTNYGNQGRTLLGEKNVLWCHYLDYPISKYYLQGYHLGSISGPYGGLFSTIDQCYNQQYRFFNIDENQRYNWTSADYPNDLDYPYWNMMGRSDIYAGDLGVDHEYRTMIVSTLTYNFKPFSLRAKQYAEPSRDALGEPSQLPPMQSLALVGNTSCKITQKSNPAGGIEYVNNDGNESTFVVHDDDARKQVSGIWILYYPFAVHYNPTAVSSETSVPAGVINSGYTGILTSDTNTNIWFPERLTVPARIKNIHQNEQIGAMFDIPPSVLPHLRPRDLGACGAIIMPGDKALGLDPYEELGDGNSYTRYRSFFTRTRNQNPHNGFRDWRMSHEWKTADWHRTENQKIDPWDLETTSVGMVINQNPQVIDPDEHFAIFDVEVKFNHFALRRYFNVTEGLSKNFYVNAIGRDDNDDYTFAGIPPLNFPANTLRLIYPNTDDFTPSPEVACNDMERLHESEHEEFFILYEYLTDPNKRFRYIDGKRQVLAIKAESVGYVTETAFFYVTDPKLIHMYFDRNGETASGGTAFMEPTLMGDCYLTYEDGVIIDHAELHDTASTIRNPQLVYVDITNIGSEQSIVDKANIRSLQMVLHQTESMDGYAYVNASNIGTGDDTTPSGWLTGFLKVESSDIANPVIHRPSEIIHHLLRTDLDYNGEINNDKYLESGLAHKDWRLALSVNKVQNSKDVVENICRQSKMSARFRISTGEFNSTTLKDEYEDTDVNVNIDTRDIIKMSAEKTNLEDVAVKCKVLYGYDYAMESYKKSTKYVTTNDIAGHLSYYNIEGEDDNILEIKADYIQDEVTALLLRDHLFNQWRNQHTKINCQLPLSYSHLEVGDVADFNIHEGFAFERSYGKRIDQQQDITGQIIYPYYLITSIKRKGSTMDVSLFQLHKLSYVGAEVEGEEMSVVITEEDIIIEEEEPVVDVYGCTDSEADNYNPEATINDGSCVYSEYVEVVGCMDETALNYNPEATDESGNCFWYGDVNLDGTMDILDIIVLVKHVTEVETLEGDALEQADLNQDGNINITDIIIAINQVLYYS